MEYEAMLPLSGRTVHISVVHSTPCGL